MIRARFVPFALAVAGAAVTAPPAVAAPGDCVAVAPARPSCSVQSAGGAFQISCVATTGYCWAQVDGYGEYLPSGTSTGGWVPYGTVLAVTVYGAGAALLTTA